jgi:hypothetical protein
MKLRYALVVGTIILAMVAGLKWLDDNDFFGNPLDKVPSVDINPK